APPKGNSGRSNPAATGSGARARHDEPVAAGFDRPELPFGGAVAGVIDGAGGDVAHDTVGNVVHVPIEFASGLDVSGLIRARGLASVLPNTHSSRVSAARDRRPPIASYPAWAGTWAGTWAGNGNLLV